MKMRAAINRTNAELANLGRNFHNSIPNADIDAILTRNGFQETQEGIYCGREGRIHEQVSEKHWLTMTWYKMEATGRYEIVAYVN
jgi:virulence-associated protein VapD